MEYLHAKVIADNLVQQLAPFCEMIKIAGSIRRQSAVVKDIEIVCLPKKTVLKDMFGWDEGVIVDVGFINQVQNLGRPIKGNAEGKYMQIELPSGIRLDLFMPAAHDYYRQLAIRTGPAEFSHRAIAIGWIRKGWVGTDQGLRRSAQCVKKGEKWVCTVAHPVLPPVWSSEQEFFRWVGLKYLQPGERGLVPC